MSDSTKTAEKWNARYLELQQKGKPAACSVLADYAHLLPASGLGLDLACGLGGNAFLLASHGLKVHAMDISAVAIKAVNDRAKACNLSVEGILRDVESEGLDSQSYDVIVISYFLNRQLMPRIVKRLSPQGLLFYQTWTVDKAGDAGPSDPEFLLQRGELLDYCSSMQLLHYHEEAFTGDLKQGLRGQAAIIAQR